jgi:hypothetical protein
MNEVLDVIYYIVDDDDELIEIVCQNDGLVKVIVEQL